MSIEPSKCLAYQRARFVTQLPLDYRYSPSHFWVASLEHGVVRVGFTKFATRMLGEMVDYGFDVASGAEVEPGQVLGWVEGFKAVSDLFCVARGCFLEVNPALEENLPVIHRDPLGEGWLYTVRGVADERCLGAEEYARLLDETIDKLRTD
jgi:glycine cleavage system H protein